MSREVLAVKNENMRSWYTRRVLDLCDTLLASPLPKQNPRSRSVSEDVAPNRLTTVGAGKQSTCSRIALDLVGQQYSDIEL
jgi:hypothetical protein